MITEKDIDGFENYEGRIANLLEFIKQQNAQAIREEAFLNYHNKDITFKKKKKHKSKAQVRKEQLTKLKTQVPKIGNVSKFFNF
jgi:hypothetical protein